jgi:hypothetical protein
MQGKVCLPRLLSLYVTRLGIPPSKNLWYRQACIQCYFQGCNTEAVCISMTSIYFFYIEGAFHKMGTFNFYKQEIILLV